MVSGAHAEPDTVARVRVRVGPCVREIGAPAPPRGRRSKVCVPAQMFSLVCEFVVFAICTCVTASTWLLVCARASSCHRVPSCASGDEGNNVSERVTSVRVSSERPDQLVSGRRVTLRCHD